MSESLKWIKSSYSASGNCVEAAARDHGNRVLVRDTKDRTGPVLRFSPVAWRRFADQVKRSLAPDPTGSADACRGHFRVLRVPLRCAQPRQHDPARARSRYPGAHVLGLAHAPVVPITNPPNTMDLTRLAELARASEVITVSDSDSAFARD